MKHGEITPSQSELDEILEAFHILEFSQEEVFDIFRLLSAILYLGNLQFNGTDAVTIKNTSKFKIDYLSDLLRIPTQHLVQSLTTRAFSGGKRESGYSIPLSYEKAIENRDALAKVSLLKSYVILI